MGLLQKPAAVHDPLWCSVRNHPTRTHCWDSVGLLLPKEEGEKLYQEKRYRSWPTCLNVL